jgi:hypothetical protein
VKTKKIVQNVLVGLFALSQMMLSIKPTQASANWQERDGIAGEIKYVHFCNLVDGALESLQMLTPEIIEY